MMKTAFSGYFRRFVHSSLLNEHCICSYTVMYFANCTTQFILISDWDGMRYARKRALVLTYQVVVTLQVLYS